MQSIEKSISKAPKLARTVDLPRIERLIVAADRFKNLKPAARIVAALFLALARIGFGGIAAPADAIGGALRRLGQGSSRATLFRRLAAIEAAGLIRRQTFKIGVDRLETIIHFEPALLSHLSTQVSNRDGLDLTSTRVPCTPTDCFNNKPAPARADRSVPDKCKGKKWERLDRIVKSLHCTARGKNRSYILSRAEIEIETPAARTSGLDWPKWIAVWPAMTIAERESVCRDIVIPALETRPAARPDRSENSKFESIITALAGGAGGAGGAPGRFEVLDMAERGGGDPAGGGAGGALRGARHGGAPGRFEVLDMAERRGGDPAGGGGLSEIDIEILKAAAGRARQRALQAG